MFLSSGYRDGTSHVVRSYDLLQGQVRKSFLGFYELLQWQRAREGARALLLFSQMPWCHILR
jgi:hypothetical protein